MGYTSPSELKQKTGFVFLGLQKLQGIFEWDAPVAAYFKYVTSSHIFQHQLGRALLNRQPCKPLTRWLTVEPECTRSSTALSEVSVRVDTNSAFKMTVFLFTERKCLCRFELGRRFWQPGLQPERDDDRQTASRWYQRLPICFCIPQDIGHACVIAVNSLSAKDSSLKGTVRLQVKAK